MTNLQRGGSSTMSGALLRRIWLGLPIAVGGMVALLLGAGVLLPASLSLQADLSRLGELEELKRQQQLLRAQLRSMEGTVEQADAQQARLFEIVSGNGDLSTLMAMVDREAGRSGVQLDLYEPQSEAAAAAGAPGAPGAARPAPATPAGTPAPGSPPPRPGSPEAPASGAGLEVPGLTRQSILVSARGSFPALLDFLRRLERLNVLVVQSDLKLLQEKPGESQATAPAATPLLKVRLSFYERSPAASGAPAAATAPPGTPAPPPGSPAAAPAPAPAPPR